MLRSLNRIPLNALRSFEAVARRSSFNEAARELGVTPSAVSLQVRRLEERLGRPLFVRGHRSVVLSETGRRLAPGLTQAFGQMDRLLGAVVGPATASLRISAMPSFASRWLAPRVSRFAEAHPQYDLRIAGEDALRSFDRDDVDLGVRYGAGPYPGLHARKLCDATAFPVCSPAYAARHASKLSRPDSIADLTLLFDEVGEAAPGLPTWSQWLEQSGMAPAAVRGPRFESHHMALTAAEAGQGLALGLSPLVDAALASGALVRPYDLAVKSDYGFWLLCREDRARERKIAALIRWIVDEMAAEDPSGCGLAAAAGRAR